MRRRAVSTAAWFAVFAILACDDEFFDQGWTHEWRVENQSGDSLIVTVRSRHQPAGHALIAPGRIQILARYSWFLGGPPDPSKDLECVSAHLTSGDLMFQQSPVENSRWVRVDVRPNESLLTMILTVGDISGGPLEDRCAADSTSS